jgi:predicted transcriptional regulator
MTSINQMSIEEKRNKINQRVEESKNFHITHKKRMEVKPNVQYTVFLSRDWYMTPEDDPENWYSSDVQTEIEDPETKVKKTINSTIFRVRQINSTDENFLQELYLSQKPAEEFYKKIKEVALLNTDSDLLLTFTKNVGSNKFKVEWDILVKTA